MPGEIGRKVSAEMKTLEELAQRRAPKGEVSMRSLRERGPRGTSRHQRMYLQETCLYRRESLPGSE